MALDQKDLELIERIIEKNGDDVAVSIARSFERLEERIIEAEGRINARLGNIEDELKIVRAQTEDNSEALVAEVE